MLGSPALLYVTAMDHVTLKKLFHIIHKFYFCVFNISREVHINNLLYAKINIYAHIVNKTETLKLPLLYTRGKL